jgi:hypothetical protein
MLTGGLVCAAPETAKGLTQLLQGYRDEPRQRHDHRDDDDPKASFEMTSRA